MPYKSHLPDILLNNVAMMLIENSSQIRKRSDELELIKNGVTKDKIQNEQLCSSSTEDNTTKKDLLKNNPVKQDLLKKDLLKKDLLKKDLLKKDLLKKDLGKQDVLKENIVNDDWFNDDDVVLRGRTCEEDARVLGSDKLRRGSFRLSLKRSLQALRRSKSSEPGKHYIGEPSGSPVDVRKFRNRSASDFQVGTDYQPTSAPVLIEYYPSSENGDLEDLKQQIDPALLHGSSSNFGGAGARSAPSTPQGLLGSSPTGTLSDVQGGASPPFPIPRSPSHHIFTRYDKNSIKQLSCSTPAMTAQAQSPEPPSPKALSTSKSAKNHTSSKGRQKTFHRKFGVQCDQEVVLNYYSCALHADILLQGHLYITKNYFAFYSNVFGYVTKILIPILTVDKITKEKTARIIPNAVGIATAEDKHVFGSLMSRDNTYRFMNEVWATAIRDMPDIAPSNIASEESDSSGTREESGKESDINSRFATCAPTKPNEPFATSIDGGIENSKPISKELLKSSSTFTENCRRLVSSPRHSFFLIATTFILVILFLSAAVLLYRIGKVQHRFTLALQDNFVLSDSENVYGELFQWQSHLHSKSAGAVNNFLDNNLDQISKVRQSLEALSTLLMPNNQPSSSGNAGNSQQQQQQPVTTTTTTANNKPVTSDQTPDNS